jgi:hypothetical protein
LEHLIMAKKTKPVSTPKPPPTADDNAEPGPDAAPNPFDLSKLMMSQSFAETLGVKKLITHIPIGKPGSQEWFRVHPDPAFRGPFMMIQLKTEGEYYVVGPELARELYTECIPTTVYTVISSQDVLRLWPIRLPGFDGKDNGYWSSARAAAATAETTWVRLKANQPLGAYDIFTSEMPNLARWPDLNFQQIFEIGFSKFTVVSMDHPVVKRLKGQL